MHDLIQLKCDFERRSNSTGDGFPMPSMKKDARVKESHVENLVEALREVYDYWVDHVELNGALVNVVYKRVIPKSSRISTLFSLGSTKVMDTIRGSKFSHETDGEQDIVKHVFTHFLSLNAIEKAISDLRAVASVLKLHYAGEIDKKQFDSIALDNYQGGAEISMSRFRLILSDLTEVEDLVVAAPDQLLEKESIVTVYNVGIEAKVLLQKYGVRITDDRILNPTTVMLHDAEIQKLQQSAPYLIAMSVNNMRDMAPRDAEEDDQEEWQDPELIPPPNGEPVIGVIDTAFDEERAYFKKWVEYHDMIPQGVTVRPEDKKHGTSISSIIVDGPKGNPDLEDHCGHFRVRHFGVLAGKRINSFEFMKKVKEIVSTNQDIKVWNISVGAEAEINKNFISPEGALLDYLQREYDIIFVVAGTNVPKESSAQNMRIGAPADSLNSIVVNAVNRGDQPASYTRVGPVLSFFVKPDVSYYGGEPAREERIVVNDGGLFAAGAYGTSVAAPWIARKLAYLIQIMRLPREVAKALILDSARGWNLPSDVKRMGYGIVPKSIKDVVGCSNREIRFFVYGTTLAYETYTTSLPVPATSKGHPFLARATMVYFPWCERNHGVDYTNTEMTLKFGRVKSGGNPDDDMIVSVNGDRQGESASASNSERQAREIYRKWDNVKRVADKFTTRAKCREAYNIKNNWGISVTTKERGAQRDGIGLPFGIVMTLYEIKGEDRYEEFIHDCSYRGWLVQRLNTDVCLHTYQTAQHDLTLT